LNAGDWRRDQPKKSEPAPAFEEAIRIYGCEDGNLDRMDEVVRRLGRKPPEPRGSKTNQKYDNTKKPLGNPIFTLITYSLGTRRS
jgi:hypothetical protein